MEPVIKPFSLLIKPASADCNQVCVYCFYSDRSRLYPRQRRRMTANVLKRLISGYMKTPQFQYIFTWQGGEPTLMGIEFYEEVVELQQKYGRPGSKVANGLQTNALLIDDRFARFLARHHFLVGVSLDGPAYIHDRFRKNKKGTGTYSAVRKGIDSLARNEVEFNILTLVSQANVKKGKEVYRFLCENGFFYHQYIECVEFDKQGHPQPYTITGEDWGNFLCEVFDDWIKSDIYRISIRLFDAILAQLMENRYTMCSLGPGCGQYVVVEFNGDVYPCDFFVRDNLKIGNITKDSWRDLLESTVFTEFSRQKSRAHTQCGECKYHTLCFGDCLKNRNSGRENPAQPSWLCSGWKMFYEHALPGFRAIAEKNMKFKKEMA